MIRHGVTDEVETAKKPSLSDPGRAGTARKDVMFKKALFLTTGNSMSSLLLLVRNIVVARLISVEDFGIASTFAITMALIEMMTQLGMDRMIVQNKDGNNPAMQAGLQAFQAMRGVAAGALLYLIAAPYAALLGVPEIAWAYQLIALIPMMRGFWHFDMHRLKREMNYIPHVLVYTVPAFLSVLAILPLVDSFGDYQVMLYAILIQQALMLTISHLTAKRPYRLTFDPALIRKATLFGWPLLVNGALLFAIFNGEKILVGRELGMETLASFALMFSLTLTPTLVLASSAQSFFLPQLSQAQDDQPTFTRLYLVTAQTSLVIAIALATGVALLGPPIVALLLGPKYVSALTLLVMLGIVQALRVAKSGLAVVALARARTGNAMMANAPRVLALPLALLLLLRGGDVMSIVWVAIAAETVGYLVALMLVRRQLRLPLRGLLFPALLAALALALVAIDVMRTTPAPTLLEHLHPFQLSYLAAAGAMLLSMRSLQAYLLQRPASKPSQSS